MTVLSFSFSLVMDYSIDIAQDCQLAIRVRSLVFNWTFPKIYYEVTIRYCKAKR
jgi:hypothetical protein